MIAPFARVAQRLVENGYSAIPIVPGEKRPGEFSRGEWRGMHDWQRFCDRLPTAWEMNSWVGWPDAGVAVALGKASRLIAVDFDYGPDDLRAKLEALIPPSPVRKRGAKGYTSFYRATDPAYRATDLPSRKWNVGHQSVVEILAHGRQTVLPPTVHPDGMEYSWLTLDTLETVRVEDLPELPADLIERIDETVRPYQTPEDRDPEKRKARDGDQGSSYWREVNDAAMANFGAWVPALFPMAKPSHSGNYRVVAHWRGGEKPNVSIHHDGITDWVEGRNFTPLDLVMAASACDLETATQWLREKLGMPQPEAVIDIDALRENMERRAKGKGKAKAKAEPEPEPEPKRSPAPPSYFDLGGTMQMMFNQIIQSARRPQPVLAVGACIAAIGVLMGRRYQTPTGLRSNVYVLGIADSGAGKNASREFINLTFAAAKLSDYLGGNKIASGAGLLSAAFRHPAILFQQDEFGMFLQGITDRKRAPRHIAEIMDHLTELYTSANGAFLGTEYGDQKINPRRDIIQPCVCLHGTTTPGHFWGALKSANAVDGSLARFLMFESEDDYPNAQEVSASRDPSQALIDDLQAIAHSGDGNLAGVMMQGDVEPKDPMVVPFDDESGAAMQALEEEITGRLRDAKGTVYTSILARQWEHTARLAMIRAVSRDSKSPRVVIDDVRWADIVVQRSVELLCGGIEKYVSDNEVMRWKKKILEAIREAGQEGISKAELARKTQALTGRDRNQYLDDLRESGCITGIEERGARGAPPTRYWFCRDLEV
jgi:hypothetical protein